MRIFTYFLFFVLIITAVHATAIGVSPSNLYFEVNQKPVTKQITIFNPNNQDVYYTISGEDFFEFNPKEKLIPKQGSRRVYAEVNPKGLPSGIHKSEIVIRFSQNNEEGIGLIPAAAIKATIKADNIGTEIRYKIRNVVYRDNPKEESKLRLLTEKIDKRIKGSLISITIVILGLAAYFAFERKLLTKE